MLPGIAELKPDPSIDNYSYISYRLDVRSYTTDAQTFSLSIPLIFSASITDPYSVQSSLSVNMPSSSLSANQDFTIGNDTSLSDKIGPALYVNSDFYTPDYQRSDSFTQSPGPVGTWNWMRIDLLNGRIDNSDWLIVNGQAEIYPAAVAPVPEPGSFLLVGAGLLGLAGLRKKIGRG